MEYSRDIYRMRKDKLLQPTRTGEYDLFGDSMSHVSGDLKSSSHSGLIDPLNLSSSSSLNITPNSSLNTFNISPISSPQQNPEFTNKQRKRAIKNRQSAQASRERKRLHVAELEKSRDSLSGETMMLRSRVSTLEMEKENLSMELCNLKEQFKKLKQLVLAQKGESLRLDLPKEDTKVDFIDPLAKSSVWRGTNSVNTSLNQQLNVLRSTDSVNATLDSQPFEYLPSILDHPLVSNGLCGSLLDQKPSKLYHVQRVYLRYRRASSHQITKALTPYTLLMNQKRQSSISKRMTIYGSARGKNTFRLPECHSYPKKVWLDKLISGCVKSFQKRLHHLKQ